MIESLGERNAGRKGRKKNSSCRTLKKNDEVTADLGVKGTTGRTDCHFPGRGRGEEAQKMRLQALPSVPQKKKRGGPYDATERNFCVELSDERKPTAGQNTGWGNKDALIRLSKGADNFKID